MSILDLRERDIDLPKLIVVFFKKLFKKRKAFKTKARLKFRNISESHTELCNFKHSGSQRKKCYQ